MRELSGTGRSGVHDSDDGSTFEVLTDRGGEADRLPLDTARTSVGADRGPFEAFFDAEHPRLYRAMYLVTGNTEDGEDLMQEAFLKVWERWGRVREMEDPVGYLYRTAMNLYRNRVRRLLRALPPRPSPTEAPDPGSAATDRVTVLLALAELPPRQRAAIVLTDLIGYSSGSAAEILGIQASTVRSLSTHARAALRRALDEPETSDE